MKFTSCMCRLQLAPAHPDLDSSPHPLYAMYNEFSAKPVHLLKLLDPLNGFKFPLTSTYFTLSFEDSNRRQSGLNEHPPILRPRIAFLKLRPLHKEAVHEGIQYLPTKTQRPRSRKALHINRSRPCHATKSTPQRDKYHQHRAPGTIAHDHVRNPALHERTQTADETQNTVPRRRKPALAYAACARDYADFAVLWR
jgi:hypothetical protein